MKRLRTKIQIGEWNFDFVSSLEVTSTWDTLTDTCTITIPKNIVFKRDGVILKDIIGGDNPIFSRGDRVVIQVGYDKNLYTAFMGRVSEVNAQRPIMISCEDEMYLLKQVLIEDLNLKDTTLRTLIDAMRDLSPPGVLEVESDVVVADVGIGDIRVTNTTFAKVLDYLRRKLGIVSYFRAAFDDDVPAPRS